MPGVIVRTTTRSGPVTPDIPSTARYFVAGLTERGRTDAAVRVRSMVEFEAYFGTRQAYGAVYDDLRTYFEEGGGEAYVIRAVGAAAAVGTRTINDAAGVPAPSVRFDALGAGAWSTDVEVEVIAGSVAGLVTARVYFKGALVETFADVDSPAAVSNALLGSSYVRATALGATIPAPAARAALSAGNDDRAAVTATTVLAALNTRAGADLGSGAVAMPGYSAGTVTGATTVGLSLMAHAAATRRAALLAGPPTADIAAITALANTLIGPGEDRSFGALLYPWVRVPITGNIIAAISPEGFAAGKRAAAIAEAGGPWRPPAGSIGQARYALGPVTDINRAAGDALDAAHVSAIRPIAGTTRLYGWRSMSTDEVNYAMLNGRDTVNVAVTAIEARLEDYVGRPIDGTGGLLSECEGECVGVLEPIRTAGGLFPLLDVDGGELDPGYSVNVGPGVNTAATLASDEIRAELALRVSPVAVDLVATVVKVGLTAPL